MTSEFFRQILNSNDIYILCSYIAGVIVLVALAMASWRAKKQDETDLRKLEKQMRDLSEKQV